MKIENHEHVVAKLAIHSIEFGRRHPIKAFFNSFFFYRTYLEIMAESILIKDELPIEPWVTHVVRMIIQHFENHVDDTRLPTEQEIISWIKERGGIPQLLLASMASTVGVTPSA